MAMATDAPTDSRAWQQARDALRLLSEQVLVLVPAGVRAPLGQFTADLNEVFWHGRPARIAVLGRPGAGKSALIAAMQAVPRDEPPAHNEWIELAAPRGRLTVLEARLPGRARQGARDPLPRQLGDALDAQAPDILLYCVAAEPDSRPTEKDREALAAAAARVAATHGETVARMGVLTHADVFDTGGWADAPMDSTEVRGRVDARALDVAGRLAQAKPGGAIAVEPVALAPDVLAAGATPWGVPELVEALVESLPRPAQLELARVAQVRGVQRQLAKSLGRTAASLAAGIAATPIPLADLPVLTALQTAMVIVIGYVSGRRFSVSTLAEFLGAMGLNTGVGFAARTLSRQVAKLMPFAGSAASAAVAYGTTVGLAQAAIAYFIEGQPLGEARRVFDEERAKAEEDAPVD